MLSRRTLIGKAAVGAAAALAVGAARTGVAATRPLEGAAGDPADPTGAPVSDRAEGEGPLPSQMDAALDAAPAPWALVAPFTAGSVVAHGWQLGDLTPVRDGSAVVTLQNERGRAYRIHLCRNDGSPEGVIHTRQVDFVVMNQGYGELPTEEHFGQAVAALAHAVAGNEATVADDVFAALLPHSERVQRFASVEGPAADGKLR
jgi:hypothetical protein